MKFLLDIIKLPPPNIVPGGIFQMQLLLLLCFMFRRYVNDHDSPQFSVSSQNIWLFTVSFYPCSVIHFPEQIRLFASLVSFTFRLSMCYVRIKYAKLSFLRNSGGYYLRWWSWSKNADIITEIEKGISTVQNPHTIAL